MKHLVRMGVLLAVLASMAWSFYDWIYIDQGPAYFAADWRRVAVVIGLSFGGGVIAFLFMRLPALLRQRLINGVLGTCLILATMGCWYAAWQLFELRIFAVERKEELMLSLLVWGSIAPMTLLWFLFLKYWRRSSRRKSAA